MCMCIILSGQGRTSIHPPLSWAIDERVIGGWGPSGPFPALCGPLVEPVQRHEFEHLEMHVEQTQFKVQSHLRNKSYNAFFKWKQGQYKTDLYFLCLKIEQDGRNSCNNKALKDHFCLSLCISFSCTKVTGLKKFAAFWQNNEESVINWRFCFGWDCPGFVSWVSKVQLMPTKGFIDTPRAQHNHYTWSSSWFTIS